MLILPMLLIFPMMLFHSTLFCVVVVDVVTVIETKDETSSQSEMIFFFDYTFVFIENMKQTLAVGPSVINVSVFAIEETDEILSVFSFASLIFFFHNKNNNENQNNQN